jgi:hypothetical protein
VVKARQQFDVRKTVSKLGEHEHVKFGEADTHQTVLKLVAIDQYENENFKRSFPSSKTIEAVT